MPHSFIYEGNSEMILAHPNCCNVITFRLKTKHLTAQHIPILGCVHCCHLLGRFRMAPRKHSLAVFRYQSRTAVCELLNGSTELFFSGVEIPVTGSRL